MIRTLPVILTLGLVVGFATGLMVKPMMATQGDDKIATWLEVVHRVCTSVGGIGTFVALIIVIQQFHLLRKQSDLMQQNIVSSMDGQLYARLDSFNKFIVEHHKEYAMLDESFERVASPGDRLKLHRLCELGFTFFEEIYKHHVRYSLLETEDWDEWQQNMVHFFGKPYVSRYWNSIAGRYARSFQTFANELLAKVTSQ